MIKNIIGGKYISIQGGLESNYINNHSGSLGVGNVRYNTNSQNFEIFDGTNWQILRMGVPSIGLTHEAEELLDWAKKKKADDEAILTWPSDHPAVKIAKENLNRAKVEVTKAEQQLQATIILSKETDKRNPWEELQTNPI